jgi:hypothetical protein
LKPRQYLIKGVLEDFFTTGQLASALGRQAVTIRKWEREGIIPKPTHKVIGEGGDPRGNRRLYTREQVEGIVAIAREEGLLKGDQRSVRATQFTDRVIELFRRTRN